MNSTLKVTDLTSPFIACHDDDYSLIDSFQLPVRVVKLTQLIELLRSKVGEYQFSRDDIVLNYLGSVLLTPAASALVINLNTQWKECIDDSQLSVLDLTEHSAVLSFEKYKEHVLKWLLGLTISERSAMARRNVTLRRELSVVRRSHEATQLAFSQLEKFTYEAFSNPRWRVLTLEPQVHLAPKVLHQGERLKQRVPGDASGLSDFAVFVSNIESIEHGVLAVQLESAESGHSEAEWLVDATKFDSTGWIRFSLLSSIGLDKQSLTIQLAWRGDTPLELGCSVAHPDPRFQAHLENVQSENVLALKCWKYIEGVITPIPSDGHAAIGRFNVGPSLSNRVLVDIDRLFLVENLNPSSYEVSFDSKQNGVLVHPPKIGIAIGRVPTCFNSAVKSISATIETISEHGPNIEYCIAIGNKQLRDLEYLDESSFLQNNKSDWLQIRSNYRSQINLYLAEDEADMSDLYLMTRLADGIDDNSFAWAIFKEISATV